MKDLTPQEAVSKARKVAKIKGVIPVRAMYLEACGAGTTGSYFIGIGTKGIDYESCEGDSFHSCLTKLKKQAQEGEQ